MAAVSRMSSSGVAPERGGIAAERGGDFRPFDIGAVGRGHAEVAGHGLEGVVFEGAVRDVVGQREQIGVHDLAAEEVVARIGHGALGGAEARGVDFRLAAVAAQRQRHAVALGARFEVGQVELEQVVARHHVRIALAHELHELLQHGLFVEVLRGEDLFPALAVGQGDGEDAVLLAVGVGELARGVAVGLDVEEQETANRAGAGRRRWCGRYRAGTAGRGRAGRSRARRDRRACGRWPCAGARARVPAPPRSGSAPARETDSRPRGARSPARARNRPASRPWSARGRGRTAPGRVESWPSRRMNSVMASAVSPGACSRATSPGSGVKP